MTQPVSSSYPIKKEEYLLKVIIIRWMNCLFKGKNFTSCFHFTKSTYCKLKCKENEVITYKYTNSGIGSKPSNYLIETMFENHDRMILIISHLLIKDAHLPWKRRKSQLCLFEKSDSGIEFMIQNWDYIKLIWSR